MDGGQNTPEMEENAILEKFKSSWRFLPAAITNEAEQAMIKSQQLLLKHNIESKYIGGEDEEKIILKRIMKQKQHNAKMRSIAIILETFFVNIVYNRGGDYIYLEIIGNQVNIEIAEYVANFLEVELDNLWDQAQHLANLKGKIAKNSFFLGVAKGYCNKIKSLKNGYSSEEKNALMVIENQLMDAKAMIYKRLSSSKSSGYYCQESSSLGEQMGRQLNINSAIDKSTKQSEALIGYS